MLINFCEGYEIKSHTVTNWLQYLIDFYRIKSEKGFPFLFFLTLTLQNLQNYENINNIFVCLAI